MDQPRWLAHAWAHLGEREVSGSRHNPRIQKFFQDVGHGQITRDETAWCAAFVGACLERSGIKSSRSLIARSYLGWGVDAKGIENPFGCVAVLSRTSDPSLGHVGFLVGLNGERVWLLGGNQSDKVSVQSYARSRLVGLRWVGSRTKSSDEGRAGANLFDPALAHVLKMEGGYTNDPVDPGGPTNKGITLGVYAAWRGTVLNGGSRTKLISELKVIADSTVSEIYKARYWDLASCETLPAAIAFMHFDTAVNHGVGTAVRMLQRALKVDVDGEVGVETRRAARLRPMNETLEKYARIRRDRYRSLKHFWRFGRGWLRRVDTTLEGARALVIRSKSGAVGKRNNGMFGAERQSGEVQSKWWGQSVTIWGALVTAAATVVPVLGPLTGIEIGAETVRQVGAETFSAVQAVVGLAGTAMAIFGRIRAKHSLVQRSVHLKL